MNKVIIYINSAVVTEWIKTDQPAGTGQRGLLRLESALGKMLMIEQGLHVIMALTRLGLLTATNTEEFDGKIKI